MGIGVCGEGWRGVGCWEGHMGYWRVIWGIGGWR